MKPGRNELPLWGSVLVLVFAVVGGSIGGAFMRNLWHERQAGIASLNWPQTEGLVVRSEYNQRRRDSNARVSYRYVVNGKAFLSTQVNVANDYMLIEPRIFVDNHPAGTKIPVYYNANDPSIAVLFPGIDRENTFCLIAFGVMLFLTGVSSVALCIRILRAVFRRPTSRCK